MQKPTVILVNLGGPRTSDEIEAFLMDLFLDPYVFDLPLWEPLRRRLAMFIARKRAPKVAEKYSSMGFGGGSPLVPETEKQAKALAELLTKSTGREWEGQVSMTCGYPNIREIANSDWVGGLDRVVLPLYPQFSRSTTLSLAKAIEERLGFCPLGRPGWVGPFARDPRFHRVTGAFILDCLQGKLDSQSFIHWENPGLVEGWEDLDLVFSAHGIPMRLVAKGDRYVEEIEESVRGIEAHLRSQGYRGRVHISYQSRVGPAKWTEPNTIPVLEELGRNNARIAIYPISFVSDHLETLEEIGVELRDVALSAGAVAYYRIPAMGVHPPFMEYLRDLVLESNTPKSECICKKLGGISEPCLSR